MVPDCTVVCSPIQVNCRFALSLGSGMDLDSLLIIRPQPFHEPAILQRIRINALRGVEGMLGLIHDQQHQSAGGVVEGLKKLGEGSAFRPPLPMGST